MEWTLSPCMEWTLIVLPVNIIDHLGIQSYEQNCLMDPSPAELDVTTEIKSMACDTTEQHLVIVCLIASLKFSMSKSIVVR